MRIAVTALAALLGSAGSSFAQTTDALPSVAATPLAEAVAAPATIRIPAGTIVEVELTEALSSRTSQQEQLFGLRLVSPIVIDGREVAPAGAIGGGEVIDAHPSAFGGREARLIVSGRYIEIAGQRVRIRGMQITAVGERGTAERVAMIPYASVAALFIHGGEVDIPAGARGMARLAVDIDVPLELAPAAVGTAPSSAEMPTPSTSGESQE